jgi:hypothetical protein
MWHIELHTTANEPEFSHKRLGKIVFLALAS